MAVPPVPPVTQQVGSTRGCGERPEYEELREASRCLVQDGDGRSIPFRALYWEQKAIVLFVRVRRERLPGGWLGGREPLPTWGAVRGFCTG